VLTVIYVIEMAVLGFIYRFLSEVPYKLLAPPVVVVVVLVAGATIFVDMKKRGERRAVRLVAFADQAVARLVES
jgi:hypothetical protein